MLTKRIHGTQIGVQLKLQAKKRITPNIYQWIVLLPFYSILRKDKGADSIHPLMRCSLLNFCWFGWGAVFCLVKKQHFDTYCQEY